MSLKLIKNIARLYTNQKISEKDGRNLKVSDLSPIEEAGLVFDSKKNKVLWAGRMSELPKPYTKIRNVTDFRLKKCLIPGLVDSHTHLIFAGNRADEFTRRCAGESYENIAKEGGGILKTVHATRNASESDLLKLALQNAKQAYTKGTRTLEVKVSYGLEAEADLRALKVVQKLSKEFPQMTFVSTLMSAHAIPVGKTAESWTNEVCEQILPRAKKQGIARYVDVFVDDGYFSVKHAKQIFDRARDLDFGLRLHADELKCTNSTEFGVAEGCSSVDHLLKISEKGIQALASSNTVATLLPGTAFYLKEKHAPARRILDAGGKVALSTDFNPGTCVTLNLQWITTLSALYLEMNAAELLAGITSNPADSLGLGKRKGRLLRGFDADYTEIPYESFQDWIYNGIR